MRRYRVRVFFIRKRFFVGLFKFVVTTKGTLNLVLHQHLYRPKYQAHNGQRVWICVTQDGIHCTAKCYSYMGKLVSKKGMHNHPPPWDYVARKEAAGLITYQSLP